VSPARSPTHASPAGEPALTAGVVAPVIPSARRSARGRRGALGRPVSPLPLAGGPPGVPAIPDGVVYGVGRIDASGRVADHTVTQALGWRGGDRLTLTARAGVVIARRDPAGLVTLPARPYLTIPAALRHRCCLRAGDHMLLAALPGQDTLAACSFAVVDQAIRAHGVFLPGKDDPS
jgi:hypothetical protein